MTPEKIRNWRPKKWIEILGTTNQKLARRMARLAALRSLNGKYLVTGPVGTGKTSWARLAMAAACCPDVDTDTGGPCGSCDACQRQGAAFNGDWGTRPHWEVDCTELDRPAIRELLDDVGQHPDAIVFLDELHDLAPKLQKLLQKPIEDHAGLWIAAAAPDAGGQIIPHLYDRLSRRRLQRPTEHELQQFFEAATAAWGLTAPTGLISVVLARAAGSFRTCLDVVAAAAEQADRKLTQEIIDERLPVNHDLVTPDSELHWS